MGTNTMLQSELEKLEKEYLFRVNEKATRRISSLIDFPVGFIFNDKNKVIFTELRQSHTVLVTDGEYNLIGKYDMKKYCPWMITAIIPYKDNYIVLDRDGVKNGLFSRVFEKISSLDDAVPFFKGKDITAIVNDNKGGLYCAERNSAMLYYIDDNNKISHWQGGFRHPFPISFFNDTLYIIDVFTTSGARKPSNIITFKNGVFSQTGISGEFAVFCEKLNSYFVSNLNIELSIRKYSATNELIFARHFAQATDSFQPYSIKLNNNHLLAVDFPTGEVKVFDVF